MTMQRVQDQDNGINIKFGPSKPRKGDYRLVSQSSNKDHNGTNKSEKNEKKEEELVPPDGGWGWLILLAAVMVNLLIPGTIKSFGVLFVEFLDIFDASPAAAAWIPSLCYFLYSSLGPLSSILSVKYSYRTVTLIGGTFAAAGMMLSYFANSVAFLCVR
ncbi:MOT7 protein, partial [Acromyrmex insinuator]